MLSPLLHLLHLLHLPLPPHTRVVGLALLKIWPWLQRPLVPGAERSGPMLALAFRRIELW
jgi:hypothetical protein